MRLRLKDHRSRISGIQEYERNRYIEVTGKLELQTVGVTNPRTLTSVFNRQACRSRISRIVLSGDGRFAIILDINGVGIARLNQSYLWSEPRRQSVSIKDVEIPLSESHIWPRARNEKFQAINAANQLFP